MPKKGTTVIAVRTPDEVAEAIRAEALRRRMTVNELLNLRLAADFRVGAKDTKEAQDATISNPDGDLFIPEEEAE